MRIVAHANATSPVEVGGQPLEQWQPQEIAEILANADASKLDVVVVEGESSPTEQIAVYLLLLEMLKAGQQVPPQLLVKLVPGLPAKYRQELISQIEAAQAQSAQAEQGKADAEIVKTLVAKGQVPPEIAQRFGLQPQNGPLPPAQEQPNTGGGLAGVM